MGICGKEFEAENTENVTVESVLRPDANLKVDRHLLIFQAYEQILISP